MGERRLGHPFGEGQQGALGAVGPRRVPRQPRQLDRVQRRGAVPGRHRAVEGRLRAEEEPRVLAGREGAAALGIAEAPLLLLGQAHRLAQPPRVARCPVQLQEALHEERVVVEEGGHVGAALPEGVEQRAPRAVHHPREHEIGGPLGRRDVARLGQARPRAGHRADHQAAPVGEHLVVGERPLAARAGVEERAAARLEPPPQIGFRQPPRSRLLGKGGVQEQHVALALERRRSLEAVHRAEEPPLGPGQRAVQLLGRPGVVGALVSVRLGVDRREEASLGARHLAQHEVEGEARHPVEARPRREGRRLGVEPGERGVVVEHLLEVRHEPRFVRRVPVEAAGELVHQAPAGHPVERRRPASRAPRRRPRARGERRGSPAWGTSAAARSRPSRGRSGPRAPPARRPRARRREAWRRAAPSSRGAAASPAPPSPPAAPAPDAGTATPRAGPAGPSGSRGVPGRRRAGNTCRRRRA